jgi:hypothetical protein
MIAFNSSKFVQFVTKDRCRLNCAAAAGAACGLGAKPARKLASACVAGRSRRLRCGTGGPVWWARRIQFLGLCRVCGIAAVKGGRSQSAAHAGAGTSTNVMVPCGSNGTSVASISSAPMRSDSIKASRVFSWALTPGRSINQPIHHPPLCLTTARYFMTHLTNGMPKSRQILRASSSTISLWRGTCVLRSPRWNLIAADKPGAVPQASPQPRCCPAPLAARPHLRAQC